MFVGLQRDEISDDEAKAAQGGLRLFALDGNKSDVGPRYRLADRCRINSFVFAAPNIGFHIRRWDDLYFMTKRHQYPRSEVCRTASFHANEAWCLTSEKLKKLERHGGGGQLRHPRH